MDCHAASKGAALGERSIKSLLALTKTLCYYFILLFISWGVPPRTFGGTVSSLSRAAIFCIIGIVGTNCLANNDSPSKAPKAASESSFVSWLKKHTSKDASMANNPFRAELDSLPTLHCLGSIELFPMPEIPIEPTIPVRPFTADDGLDYSQDFPQPLGQPFTSHLKAQQTQDPSAEGDPPFPPDSMGDNPFAPNLDSLDLMWPVETRTISSGWGPRRRTALVVVKTPEGNRRISKPYMGTHKGIDLTAPQGFSIFAAMEGRVSAVGRDRTIGNYVAIDHGEGIETFYGHNKANLVAVGEMVCRGQIIATVGSTGRSTGPHVHFEVRVNGLQVNPTPFLNDAEEDFSPEILDLNKLVLSKASKSNRR